MLGRHCTDQCGMAVVSLYSIWKTDNHSGQSGRGKNLFCNDADSSLHQPKVVSKHGRYRTIQCNLSVIYQTAEDGMGDTIKPRLVEAGADLSRVMVIDDSEEALTLSDDRIEKAVRQNHVRLVIIDPV